MSPEPEITEADVAELVERMDQAADAYIRGDIDRYLELFDHPDDYSLMPPTGGETQHGVDDSEEAREQTRQFFVSGEARLEVEASYASGDLVVLAAVERQHGEIAGFADQDLSLRVTIVFRRRGGRWQIVHRHADPLVREIPLEHLARLARGLI